MKISLASANNLTAFRLFLALMVFVDHFHTLPGTKTAAFFGLGSLAVNAFFVVSGYLVYASFCRNPVTVPFYIRRLFRIYPLLLAAVLIQACAMVAFALLNRDTLSLPPDIGKYITANLLFSTFLAVDIGGITQHLTVAGINPSMWTLRIEVMFYAIVPVLFWIWRRWRMRAMVVLFVASTVFYQVMFLGGHPKLGQQLPGQLRFFLAGIAIYYFGNRIVAPARVALIVGAAIFMICFLLRGALWFTPIYPIVLGVAVFLLAFRTKPLMIRTDLSYGVYLIHAPVIQFSQLLGLYQGGVPVMLVLGAVVLGMAFLSERWIEAPGVALGNALATLGRANRPHDTLHDGVSLRGACPPERNKNERTDHEPKKPDKLTS
jgi:peptidoglycan/LPS O-acetylase OafA/YrhL